MLKNKSFFVASMIAGLMAVSGCEAPDQEIFDEVPNDVALSTTNPKALQAFAVGAYKPLVGTWGAHNSLWSLQEVASDEMVIAQKGADWEDGKQWIRVHRHQYLPSEQSVGNGWSYCYSSIATVNNLLKNFGSNEILRSELEVLRALIYLWLIDAYGNVPIVLETDTDPTPPTKTRQEVYTFIENSVLDNLDNLVEAKTYATVNYYVAQVILAKLYLNAEIYKGSPEWQKAADACDEVIQSGVYSLESNFMVNFTSNNSASKENIFVINYDQNNGQGFNLPQMTLHYSSQATYNLAEQPWNGYATLEEFYNSFDPADERIASFITGPQFSSTGQRLQDLSFEAADPDGADLTYTPFISGIEPAPGSPSGSLRQEGARIGKWEFPLGSGSNLSNDFPIFRYGDVLLMRAEALWRLNSASTEALDLVNEVRNRSNQIDLMTLTADDLLAERGREMFAEGYRRSDLIRFGKYNGAWWEKPASDPTKNIFPIPQSQIQANPDLEQNDGY